MSGISLRIELTDIAARNGLQEILARMEDRKSFFESVGERILSSAKDRFREETAPDGTPWTPLAAATIRARTRAGQVPITILRSNSKGKAGSSLAGSLVYLASQDEVRVGSPKEHAAIHQLGGVIEKPAGTRWMAGRRFARRTEHSEGKEIAIKAHQITIPARPFLGLTRDDEVAVLEEAEDWLTR